MLVSHSVIYHLCYCLVGSDWFYIGQGQLKHVRLNLITSILTLSSYSLLSHFTDKRAPGTCLRGRNCTIVSVNLAVVESHYYGSVVILGSICICICRHEVFQGGNSGLVTKNGYLITLRIYTFSPRSPILQNRSSND